MGTHFSSFVDGFRRTQGDALELLGFGPRECEFRVVAAGRLWRLRDYGGAGSSLLVIPAPIKRPYIWDLAPEVSAVRYCLRHRLHVWLLEWLPPADSDGSAGLDDYTDQAIPAAVAALASEEGRARPFLIGHSLGGTLAAIYGAFAPQSISGLVLLGSPLCFRAGTSTFRDALAAFAPPRLPEADAVPGTLLSQLSALAAPATFVWSRALDAALSLADRPALDVQARVERWTLDEVALPGRLVQQVLQWLYREDRLCRGTLAVRGRPIGPANLEVPTLAVVDAADAVAPATTVMPFLAAMPTRDVRLIEYPGERGVGLQHLALLAGRNAYARVWPEIVAWLRARGAQ